MGCRLWKSASTLVIGISFGCFSFCFAALVERWAFDILSSIGVHSAFISYIGGRVSQDHSDGWAFPYGREGKHGVDGVEYVCSLSPNGPEKSTVLSTRGGESAYPAGVLASFCPSGCCCCRVALRWAGLGVVEVPGIARALFLLFPFGVGNGGSDLGIALRALLIERSIIGVIFSRVVREWVGGATRGCKLLFV